MAASTSVVMDVRTGAALECIMRLRHPLDGSAPCTRAMGLVRRGLAGGLSWAEVYYTLERNDHLWFWEVLTYDRAQPRVWSWPRIRQLLSRRFPQLAPR